MKPDIVFFKKSDSRKPFTRGLRDWTEKDDAQLRLLHPQLMTTEIAKIMGRSKGAINCRAGRLGLKKDKDYFKKRFQRIGPNAGNFKPGVASWRKGKKGFSYEGSKVTQFKKGQTPSTTKPVGIITLRVDSDDRIRVMYKLSEKKWIPYAHHVFSQWYGEVPKGKVIVHRNNNHLDFRLENLECITKRENWLRNGAGKNLTDGFVLATISRDIDTRKIIQEHLPQLIELKRTALLIKRYLKNEPEQTSL